MSKTFEEIKDEVLELINEGSASEVNEYMQGFWRSDDIVREVYSDCKGDGNEMTDTYRIGTKDNPKHFFVTIEGRYSSWASNSYDEAFLSKPFTFTETRYERI